ncbi:protein ROOT INITIATION DEFECTIVE 3-like [Neltuma alba]|uniref:protein ROOT INITIATION DEFECTIVE 3-like n=1 Tax=Neltuma alba TaxID=207710 RepID=UPI0010A50687|nr:protein ROOT INITIATION DEFECTIVE 3-like [Prosopis alba]
MDIICELSELMINISLNASDARVNVNIAGLVNNILVVRKQLDSSKRMSSTSQSCSRKQGSSLPPPLEKYSNSTTNEDSDVETVVSLHDDRIGLDNRGSSASEMEMERLKADCKRSPHMVDRFKKMCEDLQEFNEDDFLKSGQTKTSDQAGN